jgi:GPH family glycoside/pentoside/hexuronide:cation symporter
MMNALALLPAPLKIMGLMPEGPALYVILGGIAFLVGAAGTCGFVSCGSMMSDAVDEHELLFGARREGLFFAGLLFSVKAAAGLGGFLGGVALDVIHFPQDLAARGADFTVAPDLAAKLGIVHGPVPAVLGIAGAIALFGYRISRTELARIQRELAASRAGPAVTR